MRCNQTRLVFSQSVKFETAAKKTVLFGKETNQILYRLGIETDKLYCNRRVWACRYGVISIFDGVVAYTV